MEQYLIARPCQYISLDRNGRLRFTRTAPRQPAWMVLLWRNGNMTGWLDGEPPQATWLAMGLGGIWKHKREPWPLPPPRQLRVEAATLRRLPDLPYLLGAGKDFDVIEADCGAEVDERSLSFESFWRELTDMLSVWSAPRLTADDTADLAIEDGFFVSYGATGWDTLRRESVVSDLARKLARVGL